MSEYRDSQLTDFGSDLAQRASNGDTKFAITKVTSTADDLSQTDFSKLVSLPNEKQIGEIDRILPDPNGGTAVKGTKASFDNLNVSESYPIWAIGLYAKEDVDGAKEQLYAVTIASDPETMPKSDSTIMFTFAASIYVVVGNTNQVTINVNPDGFATKEYVADAIANVKIDTSDLAKLSQDNYYTGDNQFKYDPVNKNGDSYGLAKDIATKVTDNGDNSIEINKQAVTPVRDNKNGSINFNSKDMTPADDSAVVHTTGDEIIDGQKKFDTDPTDSAGNAYAKTVDVNQQLDKKVNIADMRKPASDVAGLEEVNAKQDKIGYTPADDSKVAHLSGANNFDTVPTVDNNPLLLASSLPSDLARTGQAQTFTAAQTFSIAPTITDASTDKGDNQAATMADLKSVEKSAWHLLKTKDVGGDFDINMLYFKDYKSDYIRIIFLADSDVTGEKTYSNYRIVVDMSKVITSFSESSSIVANLSLDYGMTGTITGTEQGTANFVIATISGTLTNYSAVIAATEFSGSGSMGDFRGINFKVNGFI